MTEHIRVPIFKQGNCVADDAELFAQLEAGDQDLRRDAIESCYDCTERTRCQAQIGAAIGRPHPTPGTCPTLGVLVTGFWLEQRLESVEPIYP